MTVRRLKLKEFFAWKDRFRNRWEDKVDALSEAEWDRLKLAEAVPEVWKTGSVYNVFLWHVATEGKRPLIDQHAWRGYCYLRSRSIICEFPADRRVATNLYMEYEEWFMAAVAGGIHPRDLDKALMAFGQFCGGQFRPLVEGYKKMHWPRSLG